MFEVGTDILTASKSRHAAGAAGKRLNIVHAVFAVLFILFVGKTLYLGVIGTGTARRAVQSDTWVLKRATILDRNGDILAQNIASGDIVLYPNKVKDLDAVLNFIHNIAPEVSIQQIIDRAPAGRKIYVKKLATDTQRAEVKNAKIAGLELEDTEWRRYPKRRQFAHVVGFVGADMNGLEGIERTRDDYLRDNRDPLILSVDSRVQAVMYDELSLAMQKYRAKGAMGMLMNARTGEMIAMVNLPDFDPENKDADPVANRMFLPTRGLFEMGSIFKVFNTAMAIESGIGLNREYYVAKPYQVLNANGRVSTTIHDVRSFKPPRPRISVWEIMLHSCNVGSAQIALDLPAGTQSEFFKRVHMAEALALEFGRTEHPLMPIKWGPVEKATVSFGHGISVTPMHTLLTFTAMTNGGIYIMPTLMKRPVGEIKGERIVSAEVSSELRKILYKVSEETSGKKARVNGVAIGGKTATAEKRINGKIDRNKNLTAYIAAFPIEAPEYSMLIVLDEPKATADSFGWQTAAWNAVPTAGRILDSIMPMLF